MLLRNIALVCSIPLWLTACATHPLPDDVTHLNTLGIVKQIRCEARRSIIAAAARFIKRKGTAESQQIGQDLEDDKIDFTEVERKLDPFTRFFIEKYSKAAIAYDFTFDMTEDNDVSTAVDFLETFTHGMLGLGLKAEADRQRETIRNFRVSDTWGELAKEKGRCSQAAPPEEAIYPVTGTIGLAEVITTFVDLNEFQHLAGKSSTDKVPVLADTFNFQTTISGSAAPKITLSPVKRGVRLSDAAVTASGSRKDIHKVIVALSLDPAPGTASGPRLATGLLGARISPSGRASALTPSEVRAIDEIYDQLARTFLSTVVTRSNGSN